KCASLVLIVTRTSWIHTLSLHDALPIYGGAGAGARGLRHCLHHAVLPQLLRERAGCPGACGASGWRGLLHHLRANPAADVDPDRSEEHTSELQSREKLVCRLLLEKKKYK